MGELGVVFPIPRFPEKNPLPVLPIGVKHRRSEGTNVLELGISII
jgi:hypothetical protein